MIDVKNRDSKVKVVKCDPPVDVILEGNPPSGSEIKIYIRRNTLTAIDEYMASDLNMELGGVLVGCLCESSSRERFLLVKNFIHAKHTTASVSRLTFTHDTWEGIDKELEKKFPDEIILGWYHSHPGHTVFLSGHDMFIQENFFNLDFMVAYVYDPSINDRGFFNWDTSDGKKETKKSSGYYVAVGNDNPVPVEHNSSPLEGEENLDDNAGTNEYDNLNNNPVKGGFKLKDIFIFVLLGANIVLSLFLLNKYNESEQRLNENQELRTDIIELKDNYRNLNQKLENFIIDTQLKEEASKDTTVNNQSPAVKYEVKQGDTIKRIATEFYGDASQSELIIKHNNLKGESDIRVGQTLEIPPMKY